jgi:hypothetical protein
MYSFEDLKEELMGLGDQESLIVPEEIEEELPLRIRTLQYSDDDSYPMRNSSNNNSNVISIDLNKYLKQTT